MNIEEKNYLLNNKYLSGNFVPIGKTRQEECYVKTNPLESLQHIFLVENIKQEILKYTKDVKICISRDPDIIFKNSKKETIAIEIETGNLLRKQKRLKEKIEYLNKKYKKRWMFIVSNKNLVSKYRKYGLATHRKGVEENITKMLENRHPQ